jgi:hypothetical protein
MPYCLGLCVLRTHIESRFCNPHVVIFIQLNIIIIIIKGEMASPDLEIKNSSAQISSLLSFAYQEVRYHLWNIIFSLSSIFF